MQLCGTLVDPAALVLLGSERALDREIGTTSVREGMAHDPGHALVSAKVLNSLAAGAAVLANGRCRNGKPPLIAATPHGGNEP